MYDEREDSPQLALDNLDSSRISFAREMRGMTKSDLAKKIDKTSSAITQIENNIFVPDLTTFLKISLALGVPCSFFARQDKELITVDTGCCHFRSQRSTSKKLKTQSIRKGEVFIQLFRLLEDLGVIFPADTLGDASYDPIDFVDIEQIAVELRYRLGMGLGPIPNIVKLVESKGAFLLPIFEACSEVDAYSFWLPDRPVIMLSLVKTPSRCRFDVAHELGHLILHKNTPGIGKVAEKQANRFAGAFLAPRDSFIAECPRKWDYEAFYRLKFRWKMSIQALVRRAFELERLTEFSYKKAMKDISFWGQRKNEGKEWRMEYPTLLSQALGLLSDDYQLDFYSKRLCIYKNELRNYLQICVDGDVLDKIDLVRPSDSGRVVKIRPPK